MPPSAGAPTTVQPTALQPASLQLGDLKLTSIWDGTLAARLDTIRELDPETTHRLVQRAAATTGADPLILPVRAFLVQSPELTALVDTGSGTTKGPTMGLLMSSLAAIGVAPADIDAVLLTHLHMDHVGGLLDTHGKPAFPNAELIIHRAETAHFLDTPRAQLDAKSVRNVEAQRAAVQAYGNRVRQVEDGGGLPGISAELAPGHTPGHTAWRISSGGHSALVIGDVVHLAAIQLPLPAVAMIYDIDPARAARTRAELLVRLAEDRTWVAGAHLPFRGIGRIVRDADGFSFEPLA